MASVLIYILYLTEARRLSICMVYTCKWFDVHIARSVCLCISTWYVLLIGEFIDYGISELEESSKTVF